jgi:hypothetical protein
MRPLYALLTRALENIVAFSPLGPAVARRALLKTEGRRRKELEAERLDRLRNPERYRGK